MKLLSLEVNTNIENQPINYIFLVLSRCSSNKFCTMCNLLTVSTRLYTYNVVHLKGYPLYQ